MKIFKSFVPKMLFEKDAQNKSMEKFTKIKICPKIILSESRYVLAIQVSYGTSRAGSAFGR